MKTATAQDVIVIRDQDFHGFFGHYIYIDIPSNDPTLLPKGLLYEGKLYGLSGHNTDTGTAAYATGKKIAVAL